jgi:hypothetical protein
MLAALTFANLWKTTAFLDQDPLASKIPQQLSFKSSKACE